jgi:hypothetical protein
MRGPVIERTSSFGDSVTIGARTITPVARTVTARWSRVGAAWSTPSAVIVEHEGTVERIPIEHPNHRILWAIRLGAIALIARHVVKGRKRRRSHD